MAEQPPAGTVDEGAWLAERFEQQRARLRAVAYRMLGSLGEADDAVQESWLRLSRTGGGDIDNLGGWLTTVVARVCLDMLRSRDARREEAFDPSAPEPAVAPDEGTDPEHEAVLADSIGLALLVVLDTLTPAERLAFVLHDMFDLPFDEIGPIVGTSSGAARQLASRARRRIRGGADVPEFDVNRQREVVSAFLAASRAGEFDALLALLDPDVVFRADAAVVRTGAVQSDLRGREQVAATFAGRARAAELALINGAVGAMWAPGGRPRVVFGFRIVDGRIVEIEMVGDPEQVRLLDATILAD